MFEGNLLGMQIKAAFLFYAVERIAQDGSIQALLMGTMHAQLVGSARLGIEGDAEMEAVDALQDFILRNGLLALSMIHYLAGAVQIIGQQGKGNLLLFCGTRRRSLFFQLLCFFPNLIAGFLVLTPNDGNVLLLYLMIQKRLLQAMIGKIGLGNQQHAAGRHVQPVNDERTGSLRIFAAHQRID